MNSRLLNKLDMYVSVQSVSKGFETTWNSLPAYVTAFHKLENLIESIELTQAEQEMLARGGFLGSKERPAIHPFGRLGARE